MSWRENCKYKHSRQFWWIYFFRYSHTNFFSIEFFYFSISNFFIYISWKEVYENTTTIIFFFFFSDEITIFILLLLLLFILREELYLFCSYFLVKYVKKTTDRENGKIFIIILVIFYFIVFKIHKGNVFWCQSNVFFDFSFYKIEKNKIKKKHLLEKLFFDIFVTLKCC